MSLAIANCRSIIKIRIYIFGLSEFEGFFYSTLFSQFNQFRRINYESIEISRYVVRKTNGVLSMYNIRPKIKINIRRNHN